MPKVGSGDALVRITVERGRIVGHASVGVIEELESGVTAYEVGQVSSSVPSPPAARSS